MSDFTGGRDMHSMNRWLARRRVLAILTFTVAMVPYSLGARAAEHPNFTGSWSADPKASDFGPMGPPDKAVMTVAHKEPEVKIHSELAMAGQPARTWEATCKTDGSDCKSTNGEVSLKVSWQGDTLVVNRALNINGMAIKVKETWALSADGKTLTSNRAYETDQGNAEQKIVFTKS
jgi:hypothetical protein